MTTPHSCLLGWKPTSNHPHPRTRISRDQWRDGGEPRWTWRNVTIFQASPMSLHLERSTVSVPSLGSSSNLSQYTANVFVPLTPKENYIRSTHKQPISRSSLHEHCVKWTGGDLANIECLWQTLRTWFHELASEDHSVSQEANKRKLRFHLIYGPIKAFSLRDFRFSD